MFKPLVVTNAHWESKTAAQKEELDILWKKMRKLPRMDQPTHDAALVEYMDVLQKQKGAELTVEEKRLALGELGGVNACASYRLEKLNQSQYQIEEEEQAAAKKKNAEEIRIKAAMEAENARIKLIEQQIDAEEEKERKKEKMKLLSKSVELQEKALSPPIKEKDQDSLSKIVEFMSNITQQVMKISDKVMTISEEVTILKGRMDTTDSQLAAIMSALTITNQNQAATNALLMQKFSIEPSTPHSYTSASTSTSEEVLSMGNVSEQDHPGH